MASAYTVGMPCQRPISLHISDQSAYTSAQWDPPAISSTASRTELSRAELRAEGQDLVLLILGATRVEIEYGSLIRPKLFWSNLSRLKCDWMISDLFPANLIVPDAMVWSDRWDWDQKWWWWIIKIDCPIRRHLKVIMVVDGKPQQS
jgi:hypothetical protein